MDSAPLASDSSRHHIAADSTASSGPAGGAAARKTGNALEVAAAGSTACTPHLVAASLRQILIVRCSQTYL